MVCVSECMCICKSRSSTHTAAPIPSTIRSGSQREERNVVDKESEKGERGREFARDRFVE